MQLEQRQAGVVRNRHGPLGTIPESICFLAYDGPEHLDRLAFRGGKVFEIMTGNVLEAVAVEVELWNRGPPNKGGAQVVSQSQAPSNEPACDQSITNESA
jgi:hypothetical protein